LSADYRIKSLHKSLENVAKFKYFLMMLTYWNCVHEEIKSRLNSENAFYFAVQNL
jgi:hypothetical protein